MLQDIYKRVMQLHAEPSVWITQDADRSVERAERCHGGKAEEVIRKMKSS